MKFDFSYLLSGKYAQWVCIALIAFLSVLIIAEWSSLGFSQYEANPVIEPLNKVLVAKKEDRFEYIVRSALFGIPVPEHLISRPVVKTLLNVTLVGVLFADKMDESQAIIATSTGEEKTYKIGDVLPGGAILKQVTSNGVLMLREGNLESLALPVDELSFDPVPEPLREE